MPATWASTFLKQLSALTLKWARALEGAQETQLAPEPSARTDVNPPGAAAPHRSPEPGTEPGTGAGPPQHWLDFVRQHAPQLLPPDRRPHQVFEPRGLPSAEAGPVAPDSRAESREEPAASSAGPRSDPTARSELLPTDLDHREPRPPRPSEAPPPVRDRELSERPSAEPSVAERRLEEFPALHSRERRRPSTEPVGSDSRPPAVPKPGPNPADPATGAPHTLERTAENVINPLDKISYRIGEPAAPASAPASAPPAAPPAPADYPSSPTLATDPEPVRPSSVVPPADTAAVSDASRFARKAPPLPPLASSTSAPDFPQPPLSSTPPWLPTVFPPEASATPPDEALVKPNRQPKPVKRAPAESGGFSKTAPHTASPPPQPLHDKRSQPPLPEPGFGGGGPQALPAESDRVKLSAPAPLDSEKEVFRETGQAAGRRSTTRSPEPDFRRTRMQAAASRRWPSLPKRKPTRLPGPDRKALREAERAAKLLNEQRGNPWNA